MQKRNSPPIGFRNGFQSGEVKMIRMLVGKPNMLDPLVRYRRRRTVEGRTVVNDFPLGPGIGPDTSGLGFDQNAGMVYECDFHSCLASSRGTEYAVAMFQYRE